VFRTHKAARTDANNNVDGLVSLWELNGHTIRSQMNAPASPLYYHKVAGACNYKESANFAPHRRRRSNEKRHIAKKK